MTVVICYSGNKRLIRFGRVGQGQCLKHVPNVLGT